MIKLKKFVFYFFQECTYVMWDDSLECVIVDPGCERAVEKDELAGFISEKGLRPKMILLTHAHLDHIYGAGFCQEKYGIPVMMDPKEELSINVFNKTFTNMGMHVPPVFDSSPIKDGDILHFGNTDVRVLSTPGHSAGGVCFWVEKENVLFSGDTLFAGSVGRTDNDTASLDDLNRSLRETLMNLDGSIDVFPGHGPATSIGVERTCNPFIYDPYSITDLTGANE